MAVSLLAGKLGDSQVSANEMCLKLTERGLLAYQPYKGVTLTDEGEAQAQQILSRRQLWAIFLVENLGSTRRRPTPRPASWSISPQSGW